MRGVVLERIKASRRTLLAMRSSEAQVPSALRPASSILNQTSPYTLQLVTEFLDRANYGRTSRPLNVEQSSVSHLAM